MSPELGERFVMDGGPVTVTVKVTPLLAKPATVITTLPVAAPLGTVVTMLVLLQLVGVAAVPLNVSVLVPCVAPKFVPAIVTDVPMSPELGERFVMDGVPLPSFPTDAPALKAAISAIQSRREGESAQVTAIAPAAACIESSSAYAAALPKFTRVVKPLPAVNVSPLPVESSTPQPKIKSPLVLVTADPLDKLVPLLAFPEVTSRAPELAIPLYS